MTARHSGRGQAPPPAPTIRLKADITIKLAGPSTITLNETPSGKPAPNPNRNISRRINGSLLTLMLGQNGLDRVNFALNARNLGFGRPRRCAAAPKKVF